MRPLISTKVNLLKEYEIPFWGLKDGEHVYDFEVSEAFFSSFEYSELDAGNVKVDLMLEKRPRMLVLHYDISGTVEVMCDRCTDLFDLEIEGHHRLIIKFGDGSYEETEEIIVVPENEHTLNVAEHILEFIQLSLPSRRVHPEGECNEEMLASLNDYLLTSEPVDPEEQEEEEQEEEIDPRWSALKGLKDQND